MNRIQRSTRGEEGFSLAEVLVAVTILGMAIVGLVTALGTASTASDYHRKEVNADIVVRSYAEAIKERVRTGGYKPCAVPSDYAVYTPPAGYTVSENPGIQYQSSGQLNVILILDRSGSIVGSEQTDLRTAANAFVDGVNRAGTHLSLISFSSDARVNVIPSALDGTATSAAPFRDAIADLVPGGSDFGGGTNWEAAIIKAKEQFASFPDAPMRVVMVTDGEPTYYLEPDTATSPSGPGSSFSQTALDQAEEKANSIEGDGRSQVFALGVALSSSTSSLGITQRTALKELTAEPDNGAVSWDPATNAPDFRSADWSEVTDFTQLRSALESVARELTSVEFVATCQPPDQGAQRLTISAASVDGRDSEQLDLIVRRP